jgi:hypothetical protein
VHQWGLAALVEPLERMVQMERLELTAALVVVQAAIQWLEIR